METDVNIWMKIITMVIKLWRKIFPSRSIIEDYKSIVHDQKSVIEDHRSVINILKDAYDPKRFVEMAKEHQYLAEKIAKLRVEEVKKEFKTKEAKIKERAILAIELLKTMTELFADAIFRIRPENRLQILAIDTLPKDHQEFVKRLLKDTEKVYIPQPLRRGYLAGLLGPGFGEEAVGGGLLGGIKKGTHEKLSPGSGEET